MPLIVPDTQAIYLLYFRFNSVMHKFYSATSDLFFTFLFKTYCMALYGCQLWNFESVCKFYVAWCKCCQHQLDIPYKTHSDLVHLLCEDDDVDVHLHCRQLKFIKNCLKSTNSIVGFCYQLAISGIKSDVSCSINHICYLYLNKYNLNMSSKCFKVKKESTIHKAGIIKDVICIREDILLTSEDRSNVSEIIELLCTS